MPRGRAGTHREEADMASTFSKSLRLGKRAPSSQTRSMGWRSVRSTRGFDLDDRLAFVRRRFRPVRFYRRHRNPMLPDCKQQLRTSRRNSLHHTMRTAGHGSKKQKIGFVARDVVHAELRHAVHLHRRGTSRRLREVVIKRKRDRMFRGFRRPCCRSRRLCLRRSLRSLRRRLLLCSASPQPTRTCQTRVAYKPTYGDAHRQQHDRNNQEIDHSAKQAH